MTHTPTKIVSSKNKDGKIEYFEIDDVGENKIKVVDLIRLAFQYSE